MSKFNKVPIEYVRKQEQGQRAGRADYVSGITARYGADDDHLDPVWLAGYLHGYRKASKGKPLVLLT